MTPAAIAVLVLGVAAAICAAAMAGLAWVGGELRDAQKKKRLEALLRGQRQCLDALEAILSEAPLSGRSRKAVKKKLGVVESLSVNPKVVLPLFCPTCGKQRPFSSVSLYCPGGCRPGYSHDGVPGIPRPLPIEHVP